MSPATGTPVVVVTGASAGIGRATVRRLARRFFPGLFDRWLAKNAWEGQMDPSDPDDPQRPSNLWEPVGALRWRRRG
jgi:hypothetical protein